MESLSLSQSAPKSPKERNKDEMLCGVCLTNEKDTALVPCGHTFCHICANNSRITICPICRTPISNRQRFYLNKYLKYKQKYLKLKKNIKKILLLIFNGYKYNY